MTTSNTTSNTLKTVISPYSTVRKRVSNPLGTICETANNAVLCAL